jgi:MtN3 and saliva related transmembrane protein
MDLIAVLGFAAAVLTTLSNLPQVIKLWRTHSAEDISFKAFSALALGQLLWVAYGILKGDIPLIVANAVSASLAASILYLKLRDG